MQSWYVDSRGRRVKTTTPVPVTEDGERTAHVLHLCPRAGRSATGRCERHEWLLPGVSRYCPEHGAALTAPSLRRRRMMAREALRLHGSSAAPWLLLGAVGASGGYVAAAGVPALVVAPVVVLAAGAGWVITRAVLTWRDTRRGHISGLGQVDGKRVRRIRRAARAVAARTAAAGAWLLLTTTVDVAHGAGRWVWVLLAGGWALLSYPRWATVEQQRQAALAAAAVPAPTAAAAPQVDPLVEQVRAVWASRIGRAGSVLAGTELVDVRRLPGSPGSEQARRPGNWAATVKALDDGAIDMAAPPPSLIGRIAAAYRCSYETVTYHADPTDRAVAHLRVQPDNVLAAVRSWPGPNATTDWAKGTTIIGRLDDGRSIVFQWYTATDGAAHALISGGTGSGKSTLVAALIIVALHSGGRILTWLADPQSGQSYGALKDHVDWLAPNHSEILFMLLAAVKEMNRRSAALAAANQIHWRPTADMPLLALFLEEAHSYLSNPVAMEMVEMLVNQGRKCGIAVIGITQVAFAYGLGGSTIIRSQLVMVQNLIFRASTSATARAAKDGPGGGDNTPIDATQIPLVWGPGTCNPGATTAGLVFVQGVNGADVYGRIDYTGTDMDHWLRDEQGQLAISPATFSAGAQRESGPLWAGRNTRRAAALAAGRNDADLLPAGKAVELINQAAAAMTATNPAVPGGSPSAEQSNPAARASDRVYTVACQYADHDGLVDKRTLAEHTPDLADGTRNRVITDLIADGRFERVNGPTGKPRQGIYRVNRPTH
jgi:hypothetical protein